ncbi:MAG TPA: UDP-N-acetylmuramate--L-alanine ligase [Candidatus Ozemobacteraceae bacterium]|nr:UDP-N-acetylmuramate--L-alanine ligase [Candidatus Ozemobacteraceae bacterium]
MNAFFVGIGGMGMSGLAKILHTAGNKVAGSDRALDGDYCRRLRELGVTLYSQDGTGPRRFLEETGLQASDVVIVKSTAVEDQVPDIVTARELGIREIMRSDLLADMFNSSRGIAVGGTAGKTTTTGLIAWVLKFAGLDPSCAVGGIMSGLETNAFRGSGKDFVIEADESDGSIVKYRPYISLITNVSRDHKSLDELKDLFGQFLAHTDAAGACIICGDDPYLPELAGHAGGRLIRYGLNAGNDLHAENINVGTGHVTFTVDGTLFDTQLPGNHNILNMLATIAVARYVGIPDQETAAALRAFPGMKRRFEHIGTARGVTIIDDFAHNPAEIAAAIRTARHASRRRFIVYQPHGFGPTRFTREDLIRVFSDLNKDEYLYLDDIFYGGGTVEKDISSKDIIDEVRQRFPNAFYHGNRDTIVSDIVREARDGDMVLVMGARDVNTLCRRILDCLQ